MTERPILMSAPMVRALLDGRKTQTRRVVKPRHDWRVDEVPDERGVFRPWPIFEAYVYTEPETVEVPCPYGASGDRLWVRETWGLVRYTDSTEWFRGSIKELRDARTFWDVAHRADYGLGQLYREPDADTRAWRPSIHMPRWASRLTLEVTAVRVERLQAISEEDAKAEGAAWRISLGGDLAGAFDADDTPIGYRAHFRDLWESINGADSWAANPWVWVVEFKRVTS